VLQAPPGAGKTTRVPLALLAEAWLDGRIVMLEPRRLAARAAARYMAGQLGEEAGGTIGYRVRQDTRVSARTRIEVVTEGVLTRMLQTDPTLDGVSVLIFDEFHERSVHADLGLALALHTRALVRPDLRVLVMSATLDGEGVARLLDDAPILTSEFRQHEVVTRYVPPAPGARVEDAVARVVARAVAEEDGDILVFLPGAAEIARVDERLREAALPPRVDVLPLSGQLTAEAQDRALAPAPAGRRRIVLATAVAETSLTIEGVRVVVDSGLMRVPRFSPRTGLVRLETLPVTKASADQRRGRAGRTGPGVCYRLYAEHDYLGRPDQGVPELLQTDLAAVVLELALRGVTDPLELRWLDAPPAAAVAHAGELLASLGAVDGEGGITQHGRAMAELPVHPRLAHMLLAGAALGMARLACELAALLGERDIVRADAAVRESDIALRIDALRAAGVPRAMRGHAIERGGLQRARAEAQRLLRSLPQARRDPAGVSADEDAGVLLAHAYPDRVARRRDDGRGRFLLSNGRGAVLPEHDALAGEEFIVVADLEGGGRDSRVYLAAALERAALEAHLGERIERVRTVAWNDDTGALRATETAQLGAVIVRARDAGEIPDDEATAALLDAIRRRGLAFLPWSDAAERTRARLAFLHHHDPTWPAVSDGALLDELDAWLAPRLGGVRSRATLGRLDLSDALLARLDWRQRARFDELAPTHIDVPSGSRIAIRYDDAASPVLAVRLQEIFGWQDTPRILGGRVGLTLHLLSPAQRPVQVTRDLASFWREGYFDVRRVLRGRYPKHYWPDDPLAAVPTRRARPRRDPS
jgi:ATP-dependent helicase HrpB